MYRRISYFAATVVAVVSLSTSTEAASLLLDENFRAPKFVQPQPALGTVLLPDGKFLLFSITETLADQPAGAITRYLTDGTLDASFNFSRDYKTSMRRRQQPMASSSLRLRSIFTAANGPNASSGSTVTVRSTEISTRPWSRRLRPWRGQSSYSQTAKSS